MDVAAGFVPGAEAAAGDAVADAFGRAAQPGIFPIVDRAGAVGGQVGEPAVGHHAVEDQGGAVAEQVGAVDQHHASRRGGGRPELAPATSSTAADSGCASGSGVAAGSTRISSATGQAPPLGQRKDAHPAQIQRRPRPTHACSPLIMIPFWGLPGCGPGGRSASRKSGITTSAPTPSSRCRFQASMCPEPLLASSLATATARPPTPLVFSIST